MIALKASHVDKVLGNPPNHILHDISLEVDRGEYMALTGKSGSGKSTLLYVLSTLDQPSRGSIELLGHRVSEMSADEIHEFRNRKMGFVFQFHHLIPELTTLENVLMPARKFRTNREKFARAILAEFGLSDKLDRRSHHLSGGEQQRVAIARALVMEPDFIFADEPTGNLDSANANVVMDIFRRINAERGTTVIYVTHDVEFARQAKRVVHLIDGRLAPTNS